jgi:hypothetical protein
MIPTKLPTVSPPKRSTELLREEEVADGINVIIDDRWAVLFPMSSRAQVTHLIESVNRAVQERYDEATR